MDLIIGAGISGLSYAAKTPNDYLIVEKQNTANNGDIVVALIDGVDVTLKTFHKNATSIALEPANPAYKTRIFTDDRVEIQGVLVGLMRSY